MEAETGAVREQLWAAYLLAWVAACTDAIGFLTLAQLGASYMSGNSMATGVALGQANQMSVLNHGLPIVSFVVGLTLGVLVLLQLRQAGVRRTFAAVFGLEAACLLGVLIIGGPAWQRGVLLPTYAGTFYGCVVLLTLAMGLQTATLRKIGSQGVRTTFVTGVLSDATEALIRAVSWFYAEAARSGVRAAARAALGQPALRAFGALSGTWVCYVLGAASGSLLLAGLAFNALLLPLAALVVLIAADLVRPFDQRPVR